MVAMLWVLENWVTHRYVSGAVVSLQWREISQFFIFGGFDKWHVGRFLLAGPWGHFVETAPVFEVLADVLGTGVGLGWETLLEGLGVFGVVGLGGGGLVVYETFTLKEILLAAFLTRVF